MKRVLAFVLVLMIVFSLSTPVFADLEDKLGNHWLKNEIDRDFLFYYFSYLAREDFNRLNPNEAIREDEFLLSFSSLLKNKGYSTVDLSFRNGIKRIDMVKVIGDKLVEIIDYDTIDNVELPFIDIEDIGDEEREVLKILYASGIIHGQTNTKFNPHTNTTQAEAIVVLQRVGDYLESIVVEEEEMVSRQIPFTLAGTIQSYTGEEGIKTRVEEDRLVVTITKMFPTPGYIAKVKEIVYENGEYRVYLDITPPDPDRELLQVVVYKIITIEIDKEELGDAPYNFVWG